MVDSSSSFTTIPLTKLANQVEMNTKANKYSLFFDKTGNCEVFFRYKATLVEVYKLSLGITMGQSADDAIEQMRKSLVYCMKSGDNLVLFCDKIAPDFKTKMTHKENFPADKIFNFAEWRKKENYKSVLRGDEDQDVFGNKGWYEQKDTFAITVLASYTDEEHVQAVLAALPNAGDFEKFIVQ